MELFTGQFLLTLTNKVAKLLKSGGIKKYETSSNNKNKGSKTFRILRCFHIHEYLFINLRRLNSLLVCYL